MTVTVFIAFIMGIGAVIAVPAGRFHYRSRTIEVVSHYILKTTQSINTIWVFLFSSEPAKGNPACLSISADKVAATGKAFIIVNEQMNYGMARY